MVLTYVNKNNLYVNITNLCTNRFDVGVQDSVYTDLSANFRLEREPTLQEILADVSSHSLNNFSEIIFCGPGEPTCRLYDMLETCKLIRERSSTPICVHTNGHSSMILAEDTAPAYRGWVDCVMIGLNAADSDTYMKLCHPKFGEDTFTGVMRFAREIVKYVPKVVLTAKRGTLPDSDVERCARIAADIGAGFQLQDTFH